MKCLKSAVATIAIIIAVAGGASASGSSAVTATGTVSDTCNSVAAGVLNFALDASTVPDVNPTATGTGVKCTKGSSHAVTCVGTHGNLSIGNDGATDPIPYTVTGTVCGGNVVGTGFSAAAPIDLGISVLGANYKDAQAGAHTDTITVTVTY